MKAQTRGCTWCSARWRPVAGPSWSRASRAGSGTRAVRSWVSSRVCHMPVLQLPVVGMQPRPGRRQSQHLVPRRSRGMRPSATVTMTVPLRRCLSGSLQAPAAARETAEALALTPMLAVTPQAAAAPAEERNSGACATAGRRARRQRRNLSAGTAMRRPGILTPGRRQGAAGTPQRAGTRPAPSAPDQARRVKRWAAAWAAPVGRAAAQRRAGRGAMWALARMPGAPGKRGQGLGICQLGALPAPRASRCAPAAACACSRSRTGPTRA